MLVLYISICPYLLPYMDILMSLQFLESPENIHHAHKSLPQKVIIHQVSYVLFPGHSHLYLWPFTLIIAWALALGHQHRWLAGGHDLEIAHF